MTRCKNYSLSNLYPARAVAAGCVWFVMEKRGWRGGPEIRKWLGMVTGGKVDVEDLQEIVDQLRLL